MQAAASVSGVRWGAAAVQQGGKVGSGSGRKNDVPVCFSVAVIDTVHHQGKPRQEPGGSN